MATTTSPPSRRRTGRRRTTTPELLELSRYKGKLHGLPKDYSPHVIWINETALQQAGVALPRPDWTWDDLLDTARRFTQRGADGKAQRLGLFNLSGSWYIPVWQNGGELFTKRSPAPC